MTGPIKMLRIEVDGHFHGSGDVPRPWVARIDGPDPRYGLRRDFVRPMNDWANARVACSGNTYGVVATFPLRHGPLYEVSRLRGKSSKRYVAREIVRVVANRVEQIETMDMLAEVDGTTGVEAVAWRVDDDLGTLVGEVRGLGAPKGLAWRLLDGERVYRLCVGRLYEVTDGAAQRLVIVEPSGPKKISQAEALSWLQRAS